VKNSDWKGRIRRPTRFPSDSGEASKPVKRVFVHFNILSMSSTKDHMQAFSSMTVVCCEWVNGSYPSKFSRLLRTTLLPSGVDPWQQFRDNPIPLERHKSAIFLSVLA